MNKRTGRQEPTASFILPYTDTDGDIAVQLYEVTGRKALPWQESIIYDLLAKDETGRWIHSKFGMAAPRRNGKNENIIIRELYALAIGEKVLPVRTALYIYYNFKKGLPLSREVC